AEVVNGSKMGDMAKAPGLHKRMLHVWGVVRRLVVAALISGCGPAAREATPAGGAASANAPAPIRRPNILWLVAENIEPADLGCFGQTQVRTPNIDRLAREGMNFSKAFCTAPVCSASR